MGDIGSPVQTASAEAQDIGGQHRYSDLAIET
ncbi:hypothetical protein X737_35650 [Mesorhizobium sp. L48C026A00]|nr:hypothetical protein X737_35650 [Mesorhizobium sp. L48C026A00]